MTIGGLAVLEALRPPPGYRTTAALGTTYSVHLVAAAVALGALDGYERSDSAIGLLAATRAIHRLSDRVRIAFQPGRAVAPSKPTSLLAALDEVLRPVAAFSESHGLYHPKLWVVRQETPDRKSRHVLVLGSKNLTTDPSWEMGIVLTSTRSRAAGSRKLEGLNEFVRHTANQIDSEFLIDALGELDELYWAMPDGVVDLQFGHHRGRPYQRSDEPKANGTLLDRLSTDTEQVIVLSPFVTSQKLQELASRFPQASVTLVAGRADLDQIANSASGRPSLLRLVEETSVKNAADFSGDSAFQRKFSTGRPSTTGVNRRTLLLPRRSLYRNPEDSTPRLLRRFLRPERLTY